MTKTKGLIGHEETSVYTSIGVIIRQILSRFAQLITLYQALELFKSAMFLMCNMALIMKNSPVGTNCSDLFYKRILDKILIDELILYADIHYLSHDARKTDFGVSDQVRHKPAYTVTEEGKILEILDIL